jgi:apolipoprotein N-acyltransferase
MNKPQSALLAGITAILLGITLTFAFAPYGIFPLAVLAPAGLLALWLKASPKKAFWLGYGFGAGLFGSGVYWVYTSIHVFGSVPVPLAILITVGFIAIISFYPALTGYCLNRFFPATTKEKLIFAFPAIWVFLEWMRSLLFSGFPWLLLGYSQTHSPLKGYAPLFSVYGVSLALTMSSGLLVYAFMHKKKNLTSSLLALLLIWLAGGLLSYIPWTIAKGKPLTVSLVQGNIPQTIKWSPEHLQVSLERYLDLTKPLLGKSNIVIWPEAAIPIPLQYAQSFINDLNEKAEASGTALILGIPIRKLDTGSYYNAVITLGKDKGVYTKRHLVPFGEYTPLYSLLANTLKFMDIPMADMTPGRVNQAPLTIAETNILPSICYEIAFPDLTRSPEKAIGLLLVITNDAWFGNSNAEPQHLQMAAMRAIEFNKPLLFVSNDGITAIIHPDGKIAQSIPQREIAVLNGSVQPMYGITPWLKNGMDPVLFLFIIFIGMAVIANKKASRAH